MGSTASYADLEVLAVDGGATKLRSLWAEGTVVLVFLRHFG